MAAEQNNLWTKCMDGKLEEVRLALQAGADPNTRGGSDNWTCLMVAIWKNYEELVDLLLAQPGIEVNAEDQNKDTALYYTCYIGNVAILSKLLDVPGLQMNKKNVRGRTPIMRAIRSGQTEAVRLMAAVEEVDLDLRDGEEHTLEDIAHIAHNRRKGAGGPADEIVAVLGEAREKRERKRLVREQKNRVSKVLLDGVHDEDSLLHALRAPNNVVEDVMPIVWEYLIWDWQVYGENQG